MDDNFGEWVESMGVVSECCKEVYYRYSHNCERSEPVTRVGWRISLVYIIIIIYICIHWQSIWSRVDPVNAQRANVGSAG